jgi:hypothetical protein
MDKDRSGKIDADEFMAALDRMGIQVSSKGRFREHSSLLCCRGRNTGFPQVRVYVIFCSFFFT